MLKINTAQTNLWFTSDPHYNQLNIVEGISTWEGKVGCRPFQTLKEHDDAVVNNINAVVKEDDILICLGDWSFGTYKESVEMAFEFRKRLNCKNIYLILGNHDQHIRKNKNGIQGCFKGVYDYLELSVITPQGDGDKAFKQKVILSHYAMRVWNHSHRGSYMLYGHSHGNLDEMTPLIANPTWIGDQYYIRNYKTMDVGIDTHKEFRPYSWKEIDNIMKIRNVDIEIDHHGTRPFENR